MGYVKQKRGIIPREELLPENPVNSVKCILGTTSQVDFDLETCERKEDPEIAGKVVYKKLRV